MVVGRESYPGADIAVCFAVFHLKKTESFYQIRLLVFLRSTEKESDRAQHQMR